MNIVNQATAAVVIQPFVKAENTTLQDFNLFKLKLESFLGLNGININGNGAHQQNAIRIVIIYGGDWMAREVSNMNYGQMTYAEVMTELALHFRDRNIQFHQLEFLETGLHANEKLMDFISRLRPIARAANMETDDLIKLRIAQSTTDDRLSYHFILHLIIF